MSRFVTVVWVGSGTASGVTPAWLGSHRARKQVSDLILWIVLILWILLIDLFILFCIITITALHYCSLPYCSVWPFSFSICLLAFSGLWIAPASGYVVGCRCRLLLLCCLITRSRRWIPLMTTTSTLPTFITDFVASASPEQKQCLLDMLITSELDLLITSEQHLPDPEQLVLSGSVENTTPTVNHSPTQISDYVIHVDNLNLQDDLSKSIDTELKSLNFKLRKFKYRQ